MVNRPSLTKSRGVREMKILDAVGVLNRTAAEVQDLKTLPASLTKTLTFAVS